MSFGSLIVGKDAMQDMAPRQLSHRLSHILVRLLAAINIADAITEIASPRYAHAVANGLLGDALARWWLISVILLPMYTAFEFWWMRSVKSENIALWIDGAVTAAWFLIFWSRILYLFTHRVLF